MGIVKNYYESSKRDINKSFEKLLNDKEYEYAVNNIKDESLEGLVQTREEAEAIILKKYDRKSFIRQLKRQIKPQVIDNMNERLDGRTKEEVELERKEQIKKYAQDMENPESIESKLDEENKEETKATNSIELRSEVIKAVYEETLKQYYRLVNDLQTGVNRQVKTGSILNGTKMDNKLLLYQNYLRKLDMWYRNLNHGMPIAYDEKINELLNKNEYEKNKNDLLVNKKREDKIEQIEQINKELDDIAEKMTIISNRNDNSRESTEELKMLSNQYRDKKLELANLKPSIGILYTEEKEMEKIEDYKSKIGLSRYEEKTNRKVLDKKLYYKEKKDEHEDDKMTGRVENTVKDMTYNNLSKAKEAINKCKQALTEGRYSDDFFQSCKVAEQLYQSASDITDDMEENGNSIEEIQAKINENDKREREEELNDRMGIGAIRSDDEILENDLKNYIDNLEKKIDRAIETYERCR